MERTACEIRCDQHKMEILESTKCSQRVCAEHIGGFWKHGDHLSRKSCNTSCKDFAIPNGKTWHEVTKSSYQPGSIEEVTALRLELSNCLCKICVQCEANHEACTEDPKLVRNILLTSCLSRMLKNCLQHFAPFELCSVPFTFCSRFVDKADCSPKPFSGLTPGWMNSRCGQPGCAFEIVCLSNNGPQKLSRESFALAGPDKERGWCSGHSLRSTWSTRSTPQCFTDVSASTATTATVRQLFLFLRTSFKSTQFNSIQLYKADKAVPNCSKKFPVNSEDLTNLGIRTTWSPTCPRGTTALESRWNKFETHIIL